MDVDQITDQLVRLLRDMDRQQQQTDAEGGREVAWYYWRDSVEDALGVPRGTLDTDPPSMAEVWDANPQFSEAARAAFARGQQDPQAAWQDQVDRRCVHAPGTWCSKCSD